MRACLIHSTGTLWLAGDPAVSLREHPGVDNLRIAGGKEIQTDLLVGAEAALHTDRGNLQTTVTFETSRLFATPAEAQVWSGIYDATQANTGTLAICEPATTAYALLNFPGAVIMPPERRVIGCTVMLSYEVLAGLPVEVTRATSTMGVLTVVAGNTVTIGGVVFTATDAANPVAPLFDKTRAGLIAAINAHHTAVTATASDALWILLSAIVPGTAGNDILLSSNSANIAVVAALTGGAGTTP